MSETELVNTTEYSIEQINKQHKLIRVAKLCNNISVSTIERPLDILGIFYVAEADKQLRFKTLAGLDFGLETMSEILVAAKLLNSNLVQS